MSLSLYNTLSRKKEEFQPVHPPQVGVYLCGPTVYSEAHLGNARGPVVFDVLTRYLRHAGYQVRYVRNITDVGHLESDADTGEDKMEKAARAARIEPMQVAQHFTNRYRQHMLALGCLPPDIEPQASGHIIEQIQVIEEIIANGLAYEVNGSVYFDVPKYNETQRYGKLSNRSIEDQLAGTRANLEGQSEKRSPLDFALWKKASPEHIMQAPIRAYYRLEEIWGDTPVKLGAAKRAPKKAAGDEPKKVSGHLAASKANVEASPVIEKKAPAKKATAATTAKKAPAKKAAVSKAVGKTVKVAPTKTEAAAVKALKALPEKKVRAPRAAKPAADAAPAKTVIKRIKKVEA